MAISESIFAPTPQPLDIAVLVLPRASILEVASVLDPLRAANRHLGRAGFRWRVVSPEGGPVPLTCGIELPSSGGLAAAEGAEVLIAVAGYSQAEVATRALLAGLRRMAGRFRAIGGVDAGPWVLARAGLLDGHRATVHWEDLEDFAAAFPAIDVVPDRFVISRNRFTAGGAVPAADLMLHLIGSRCGAGVAGRVADSFLYETRADGARPQRPGLLPGARDPRLSAALTLMSQHLDEPLDLALVAGAQGIGLRRLEQLFREGLGQGPGAAYLELRLQAARRMMADTAHPIQEIALRCGFADRSSFSRAFRRRFGLAPRVLRGGKAAG
ncbi:GlxA family transcriptional regulator [Pararhodobacter aggregans]|uniref:GlxA family transcriptional regulator n=1 Tax=Pararhodobacter aggregans TaxID=404875 RepID=A0A2T7UQQ9_9RHOB|nr:GlxA family transcriptional regulator [Pararhodobacter aggregans]PTX01799.1 AraC family transcriptional regulator with amidase-like domain [Pararhodobacter aggregans]PVE47002.1 GlxA family transcriptional regulator [Pararhodobacter aggregans]